MDLINHRDETYRNTLREASKGLEAVMHGRVLNGEATALTTVGRMLQSSAYNLDALESKTREDIEELYHGMQAAEIPLVLNATGKAMTEFVQRPDTRGAEHLYPFVKGFLAVADTPRPIEQISDSYNGL